MTQIVTGATAIARAVGLKPSQVYNLRKIGRAPIHNKEGVGLVADPQELKDWLLGKHTQDQIPQEERPAL